VVQEILQVYLAQDSQHYQPLAVVVAVQAHLQQQAFQEVPVVQVAVVLLPAAAAVLVAKVITVVLVYLVRTVVVAVVVAQVLLVAIL
jgi:MFS superfamily sulfate permease-like transporter